MNHSLHVPVLQAFVDANQGGNPAGVVLHADAYDTPTRQQIATRLGLSETAFVSASSVADYRLEFFTPRRPIAQCGHATVAAFSHLAQQGLLPGQAASMETGDGVRAIRLDGDQAFMEQRAPTFTAPQRVADELSTERLLQSLHLTPTALPDGLEPIVVNTGNSFLIVPLRSATAVGEVVPDLAAIETISERLGLIGYYIFSTQTQGPGRDAGARMFAPAYGIAEEAATGMAAGPLACYLHHYMNLKQPTYLIEQGYWMQPPSPSLLTVRLERDNQAAIQTLWVGGQAKVSHSVPITLPV